MADENAKSGGVKEAGAAEPNPVSRKDLENFYNVLCHNFQQAVGQFMKGMALLVGSALDELAPRIEIVEGGVIKQ